MGRNRAARPDAAPGVSMVLSVLDLAPVAAGQSPGAAIATSVELARAAERAGYRRVWYAEHHGMATVASSAPAVLVGHVADATSTIRVGAGGVMLPNHSPLAIAEQFGTLEAVHPGRIDLGVGRAPGSDRATAAAMRRDPGAADRFPDDVVELQGYLAGRSTVPGVTAVPFAGSRVPLYVLGSSTFGARLAAVLGLPYAAASHFAPAALHEAVALYRDGFEPSEQLDRPHVIAGVNAVVADTAEQAAAQHAAARRWRVAALLGRGRAVTEAEAEAMLASPAGAQVDAMMVNTVVGTPGQAREQLAAFARRADADELIVSHLPPDVGARLRSVELAADAVAVAA